MLSQADEARKKKTLLVVAVCMGLATASIVTTGSVIAYNSHKTANVHPVLALDLATCSTVYEYAPMGNQLLSEEEFEQVQDTTVYSTYSDYVSSTAAHKSDSVIGTGYNAELFSICDQYFKCYYGDKKVSPLYPMAVANAETPGRADHSKTWSSLFPSAVVNPKEMSTFCVKDVVRNNKIFKMLGHDFSTRDRGALQMSPTYGTNDDALNAKMSGNEVAKLGKCEYPIWASRASSEPGDRFYLPDMLLRLQAACNLDVHLMIKNNYLPKTDMMLIAMLAIAHNTGSGIWYYDFKEPVGNWKNGNKAYSLCSQIGSNEFVQILSDYAKTHDSIYMNRKTARSLYENHFHKDYKDYCKSDINFFYPIEVMYNYIKLSQLYTGT